MAFGEDIENAFLKAWNKGWGEGWDAGQQQERRRIANSLIDTSLSDEDIARITGMSINEIIKSKNY